MTDELQVLGIDLGTTHSVVAHARGANPPRIVELPQWVAPGQVEARPLLPSYLYAPLPHERFEQLPGKATSADQSEFESWVVGEHARRRGLEVADRVVASSKSWLCHAGVDRHAAILPWSTRRSEGAAEKLPRLSPVEASRRVLEHVRDALSVQLGDVSHMIQVLTVPASFDQAARTLTLQAAHEAGFSVALLEEPQAAFYDFMQREGDAGLWRLLQNRSRANVLVCDVGGGTTDLTLIAVQQHGSELRVERAAVGRHLLLGGDNIDLALAHRVESEWKRSAETLSPAQFAELVLACRTAKERLLSRTAPASVAVSVAGRGSALVGHTLRGELTREVVESIVFNGFLPEGKLGAKAPQARAALSGFGLPYERDPAITRHVGAFLLRHGITGGDPDRQLDAVLFNGGLFRAPRVVDRLVRVLSEWMGREVQVLPQNEPDLAVARGAVAYGQSLRGLGRRIGGGSAHGYYVGLHAREGTRQALCVLPRGAREGERHRVFERSLALTVGTPVRLELFASDTSRDAVGGVVDVDEGKFVRLPPVVTTVDPSVLRPSTTASATAEKPQVIPVGLEGELTAIGTVQLACVGVDEGSRRLELSFDLRSSEAAEADPASKASGPLPPHSPSPRAPAEFEQAREALVRAFGKGRKDVTQREIKDLLRELERLLGARRQWTLKTNRALFDVLAPLEKGRRRSPDHERLFFLLAGFCLRPGFGEARDAARVEQLAQLFSGGLSFGKERIAWEHFFIAYRRIAPGLSEQRQAEIRALCDPFVAPPERKLKRPKGFKPMVGFETLELLSWLERVDAEHRSALGQWILDRTWTDRDPRLWQWLGRIGARVPAYASAHYVLGPRHAERWLEHLLSEDWSQVTTAAFAAVQLSRVTGDRARDISDGVRTRVLERLSRHAVAPEWIAAVEHFVPVQAHQRAEWYGEELPIGLVLLD